ncbi:MAG TPA: hypothetical protein VGO60_12130 [Iamia sp.]|jgi:hypothetical protein|nr:hypothetical protein [Iamia sp.]
MTDVQDSAPPTSSALDDVRQWRRRGRDDGRRRLPRQGEPNPVAELLGAELALEVRAVRQHLRAELIDLDAVLASTRAERDALGPPSGPPPVLRRRGEAQASLDARLAQLAAERDAIEPRRVDATDTAVQRARRAAAAYAEGNAATRRRPIQLPDVDLDLTGDLADPLTD